MSNRDIKAVLKFLALMIVKTGDTENFMRYVTPEQNHMLAHIASGNFSDFESGVDYKGQSIERTHPQRMKGHWTKDNSCPFCGKRPWYEYDIHTLKFCPYCGADMREESNERTE